MVEDVPKKTIMVEEANKNLDAKRVDFTSTTVMIWRRKKIKTTVAIKRIKFKTNFGGWGIAPN